MPFALRAEGGEGVGQADANATSERKVAEGDGNGCAVVRGSPDFSRSGAGLGRNAIHVAKASPHTIPAAITSRPARRHLGFTY
jgi:hypothetical protein